MPNLKGFPYYYKSSASGGSPQWLSNLLSQADASNDTANASTPDDEAALASLAQDVSGLQQAISGNISASAATASAAAPSAATAASNPTPALTSTALPASTTTATTPATTPGTTTTPATSPATTPATTSGTNMYTGASPDIDTITGGNQAKPPPAAASSATPATSAVPSVPTPGNTATNNPKVLGLYYDDITGQWMTAAEAAAGASDPNSPLYSGDTGPVVLPYGGSFQGLTLGPGAEVTPAGDILNTGFQEIAPGVYQSPGGQQAGPNVQQPLPGGQFPYQV